MSLDAAIAITARLAEARELAMRLYGARYEENLRPFRKTLQQWQRESGKPIAFACKCLIEQADKHGTEGDMLRAMAAAYEEMAS